MPRLPHILEMVVRNSSTLTNAWQFFLFTLPNLFMGHHSHGGTGGRPPRP